MIVRVSCLSSHTSSKLTNVQVNFSGPQPPFMKLDFANKVQQLPRATCRNPIPLNANTPQLIILYLVQTTNAALTKVNTRRKLPALDVDVEFIDTVLRADKPGNRVSTSYGWGAGHMHCTHKVRPSSLHASPAVLSGDGGVSKTPWSGSVPRIALSSQRLTT